MDALRYQIGLVGLGVMGRNLALNMADHQFSVLGMDKDPARVTALLAEGAGKQVGATGKVEELIARLAQPRAILLLVPAGAPVDELIAELVPHLRPGDLIIDGGNSHFRDTERREKSLFDKSLLYLGLGISGGEEGARRGPSLMAGGRRDSFEGVKRLLEAISAKVGSEPCAAYLGSGGAGHFVKMVHNGIEYALMQLLAESYDLMKRGLGMGPRQLHDTFSAWNRTEVAGFLVQITAQIFQKQDPKTGGALVEQILDTARQKGTGKWTVEEALHLQIPTPTIDSAVAMRGLSARRNERESVSRALPGPPPRMQSSVEAFLPHLRAAFHSATILTFAQGMALLREAGRAYAYGFKEEAVARVWRGGCIIRAAVLDEIARAYAERPELAHLALDPRLGKILAGNQSSLRRVTMAAAEYGLPAPAFAASLGYFDACRSARLPTNLIQAQRDFFGAHTYERLDEPGTFHTDWS